MERGYRIFAASITLSVGATLFLNYKAFTEIFSQYFVFVGKTNNSSFREILFRLGLKKVEEKPWFGSFFTDEVVVTTNAGRSSFSTLPAHNDFLTIAIGGGIIALAAFLMIIYFVNTSTVLNYTSNQNQVHKRTTKALLISANSAFISMVANPILLNVGSSLVLFSILYTLRVLNSKNLNLNFNSKSRNGSSIEI
jgi:O-antigen ligase